MNIVVNVLETGLDVLTIDIVAFFSVMVLALFQELLRLTWLPQIIGKAFRKHRWLTIAVYGLFPWLILVYLSVPRLNTWRRSFPLRFFLTLGTIGFLGALWYYVGLLFQPHIRFHEEIGMDLLILTVVLYGVGVASPPKREPEEDGGDDPDDGPEPDVPTPTREAANQWLQNLRTLAPTLR